MDGKALSLGYDMLDNPTSETDARGNVTETNCDALGCNTSVYDAMERSTLFEYDPARNVTKPTDLNGAAVTYEYEDTDRLAGQATSQNKIRRCLGKRKIVVDMRHRM